KTRMNIAQRHLQQVVFLHPFDHQPIGHPVTNQRIRDVVTNFIGIAPFIRHTRNRCLEILAASTAGLIHADLGDNPSTPMQSRHMRNATRNHLLPFAFLPALRTGVVLGLDRFVFNIVGLTADKLSKSHWGLLLIAGWIPYLSAGALLYCNVNNRLHPTTTVFWEWQLNSVTKVNIQTSL